MMKIKKFYYLRKTSSLVLALSLFTNSLFPVTLEAADISPGALPTGHQVVIGNVTYEVNGSTATMIQQGSPAINTFDSFDIGSAATVNVLID